jgi:DNA polymerase-3 subunit beta
MEFLVNKSEILKATALVNSVTSSKTNTLPILGNLLLETTADQKLSVSGTDLEVGLSTKIPAKIVKEGSITVPARKMLEIVRELPEGDVEFSVAKNNAVTVRMEKSFFKIMGLSKDDYPKLPEIEPQNAITADQFLVKESLQLTSFAISYDETRYVLNGVLIAVQDDRIKFVATDGRRLAFMDKKFDGNSKSLQMIVPTKAVQELIKILGWESTVQIIPSKTQVVFQVGDTTLFSRLIEGHFPNYEQVIPKAEKTTAGLNREDFLQAVRRASLLTSTEAPALKLDFLKGKVLVSSRAPNLGEAREEIQAEVKGDELSIGFNPQYLMDVLKSLDEEKIAMSLSEPDKPGLVRGKEGYLYVIMPMQLT